jgi:hypothetical protein
MFRGSMVAVVTPMKADGALDFEALTRLVEFHIDQGTDGIIAVGTTGESATVDFEEHIEVVRWVVKQVKGRIPVIAGTGANSTDEALHLTQRSMEAGADACLLVTPYYNKPTQEGLYRHYKLIANSVAIPQILYNVPSRTACDLKPETVERLADIPNIIGIKEASTLERIQELLRRCGDRLDVFSGDDGIAAEAILSGGQGRDLGDRQCRAPADARHEHGGAGGRPRPDRGDQSAPDRAASGIVCRIQPDPGQVGGQPDGPDSARNPVTADAAFGIVSSRGARRHATGRGAVKTP